MNRSLLPKQIPWDCDFLATSGGGIFRAYALPAKQDRLKLAVICNPLGEEAKSSFGTLTRLARALWAKGWGVARFDYPGTGDSEGDFASTLPADWIQSGLEVIADLRERVNLGILVLMGVRLGGNVAAAIAARLSHAGQSAAGVALWTPAVDIEHYVQHLHWVSHPAEAEGGGIDHLGWHYSAACLEAMPSVLSLPSDPLQNPVLLAHVSAKNKDVPWGVAELAVRLTPPSQFIQVHAQPFWERINTPDDYPIIDQTCDWLDNLCR